MPSPEKYWEILDRKIQQEVGWVQQRMSWLATFQGLLFATFGLMYQAFSVNNPQPAGKFIMLAVALVGLFTCLCIMGGLWAANGVLTKINDEWERLVPVEKERKNFPDLRTEKIIRRFGMLSTWGPAILFTVVWLIIILFVSKF